MRRIRKLTEVLNDGPEVQPFVLRYVGGTQPPELPHKGIWSLASNHWVDFNGRVLGTDVIPRNAQPATAVVTAEKYSVIVLWALAKLCNCPDCPNSVVVDKKRLNKILRKLGAMSDRHDALPFVTLLEEILTTSFPWAAPADIRRSAINFALAARSAALRDGLSEKMIDDIVNDLARDLGGGSGGPSVSGRDSPYSGGGGKRRVRKPVSRSLKEPR